MKSRVAELCVHIGLPKCGSTSLQRVLIDAGEPGFLGKIDNARGAYVNRELAQFFRRRIPYAPATSLVDAGPADEFHRILPIQTRPTARLVVSDEVLSGFGIRNFHLNRFPEPTLALSRLRRLASHVRILVVVRRQSPFLESYYAELIKHGYNATYEVFLRRQLRDGGLSSLLAYDRYLDLVAGYCDELIVVPLEAIAAGDELARDGLARFGIAVDSVPRLNQAQDPAALAGRLLHNLQQPMGVGVNTPLGDVAASRRMLGALDADRCAQSLFAVSESTRDRWLELIRSANRRLGERHEWIEAHGYAR